eukprot:scaffold103125_cov31-Tisochrysis_lutea.AAC.1
MTRGEPVFNTRRSSGREAVVFERQSAPRESTASTDASPTPVRLVTVRFSGAAAPAAALAEASAGIRSGRSSTGTAFGPRPGSLRIEG